ncbi:MAG: hypothetical protein EPN91_06825 [Salinibacterium sp.]|nr:MAG: hypothetical protein EPN91_06825 [Salinibacterium sp.]
MRRIVIESPYAGDINRNLEYLGAALRDSLRRGEAPFASHALYTAVLDDDVSADRELGIAAGLRWGEMADATVVYTDLGISRGMEQGIAHAKRCRRPIEFRALGPTWRGPGASIAEVPGSVQ